MLYSIPKHEIQSILIYVGTDLLGDGLLKMPFITALRAHYPTAKITWLAGQGPTVFSDILAPLIDGKIDEVIADAKIGVSFKEILSIPLKGRHFDLVIDTQKGFFTTFAIKRISHKYFLSPTLRFFYSDIKYGEKLPKNLQKQFKVFLELATGQQPDDTPFSLDLDQTFYDMADQILENGPDYVGLAPGAGGHHKRWPLDKFISAGQTLIAKGKTPVYFLGPGETDMAPAIRKALPEARLPLQDYVGEHGFNPAFTLALAKKMQVNVTNDAGVGHICSLSAKPQIMLFGPTTPKKFRPISGNIHIIQAQEFGGDDMALIEVDTVVDKIIALHG